MRLTTLLFVLSALFSTSLLAQQPPKMPATGPATGAPGTATPQPYAPVAPQHLPAPTRNNPPLLKQAPLPEPSQPRRDQELPLLKEQRERNTRPLPKSDE
ncbi:conserved exported hypothetical protein [Pseudomonas sp. 8BK]|uniref:hypothetical protein n=1 Tax=Pseudomonas sp. 8BK TaxID=2653164 RepID=UPI0012EF2C28|nr:hypothetical protein [Pseudomonas sp. 8BK]VXB98247.1 conserved exported hypothetical protein [Pseudomonas sp. 8BK]